MIIFMLLHQMLMAFIHGAIPANWIAFGETSLENTISIVGAARGAVTIRLRDTYFHLNALTDSNGLTYVTWNDWPDSLKHEFVEKCSGEIKHSFVCNIPSATSLRLVGLSRVEFVDYAGKTINFAKRLMDLDGFFNSLLFNIVFNLLLRLLTRPLSFSRTKVFEDVVTGSTACVAVCATKYILLWLVGDPSPSLCWTVGTCAGFVSARIAKYLLLRTCIKTKTQ